jgi:NADH-quinone oxidoreductase subunit M
MLKLGGYGVLKFMLPLFSISTHLYFRPLALFICVLGTIYGGLNALRQIDMKRQIAFSSISHISFSSIGIFTFTEIGVKGSIYLMLSHGLTSAALFYLIGILSDRYHTRSIIAFSGLLSSMPLFSFFFIFMSLANIGFPGTSGFLPELIVLISLISAAPFSLLPALAGMFLTTVSSLILLLRILYGHLRGYSFKSS